MARTVRAWIRDKSVPLTTIDPADPLDDLAPFGQFVGAARVVALGESSHHVHEFYRLRHRLIRYLVERHGFTVLALEAPFTEALILDHWVHGGAGTAPQVASAGVALGLGDTPEFHETLTWIREHNAVNNGTPLRCVGADLPGSLGSPLPALQQVHAYLLQTDTPGAELAQQAIALAEKFHDPWPITALSTYPLLSQSDRDALSATLGLLLARMRRTAPARHLAGHGAAHEDALHHLMGAWQLDHLHRSLPTEGISAASTFRDHYIAASVLRLLENDPGCRVILAAHNWHIHTATQRDDGGGDLYPAGHHLRAALRGDYLAVALTAGRGTTGVAFEVENPETPSFTEATLPPTEPDTIESIFPDDAAWYLADLRGAADTAIDAAQHPRMRMADYFLDQPALTGFDAIAHVTETRASEYARGHANNPPAV
ncbi:erythromycin esterase family protein [Actinophytocola algeriensis]|nr:erythromycin esterase family protein [Actinophytocola algeriensis]